MTEPKRVATFNLGNLARAGSKIYETEPRTAEEYAQKTEFLRQTFGRLDADVLAVQEILHRDALVEAAEGLYTPEQIHTPLPKDVEEATARSPRVGLLSKLPLFGRAVVHRKLSNPQTIMGLSLSEFRRPVLHARVWLWPEVRVSVFVVHLKSPRPLFLDSEDTSDPACAVLAAARAHAVRFAEIAQLKVLTLQAALQEPVIVLGDLNTKAHDVALDVLKGRRAPAGANATAHERFEAARLHNGRAVARRSGGVAFGDTFVYRGHPEVLDHLFVSGPLTPFTPGPVGTVRSIRSLSDHLGDDPHSLVRVASDHAPVLAIFERWPTYY